MVKGQAHARESRKRRRRRRLRKKEKVGEGGVIRGGAEGEGGGQCALLLRHKYRGLTKGVCGKEAVTEGL